MRHFMCFLLLIMSLFSGCTTYLETLRVGPHNDSETHRSMETIIATLWHYPCTQVVNVERHERYRYERFDIVICLTPDGTTRYAVEQATDTLHVGMPPPLTASYWKVRPSPWP